MEKFVLSYRKKVNRGNYLRDFGQNTLTEARGSRRGALYLLQ